MKRTIGKDKDYRKALLNNLIKSLSIHKRIKTTVKRGKQLKAVMPKLTGGVVKMVRLSERRGDGVMQVLVTFEPKQAAKAVVKTNVLKDTVKQHENKSDKRKSNKKKVASG